MGWEVFIISPLEKKDLVYVVPNALGYVACSQSVAPGLASSPSLGTLSEMQILGPLPDLLNQKL